MNAVDRDTYLDRETTYTNGITLGYSLVEAPMLAIQDILGSFRYQRTVMMSSPLKIGKLSVITTVPMRDSIH